MDQQDQNQENLVESSIERDWSSNLPTTEEELQQALKTIDYTDISTPYYNPSEHENCPACFARQLQQSTYTWNFVEPLLNHLNAAEHEHVEKSDSAFAYFPKLPPELRLSIWEFAIASPRIVELIPCPMMREEDTVSFKNTYPSPLLLTCLESRQVVLSAYKAPTGVPGPEWLRFDVDTYHLKFDDASFPSPKYIRPNWNRSLIKQWNFGSRNRVRTDKWLGRPELFENLRILAVNYELLACLSDDFECAIRHFFPRLLVLVVLVCDANLKVFRNIFGRIYYRCGSFENLARHITPADLSRFVHASHGPFTSEIRDKQFAEIIKSKIQHRLQAEAASYEDYHPPQVVMKSCSVPSGYEYQP